MECGRIYHACGFIMFKFPLKILKFLLREAKEYEFQFEIIQYIGCQSTNKKLTQKSRNITIKITR